MSLPTSPTAADLEQISHIEDQIAAAGQLVASGNLGSIQQALPLAEQAVQMSQELEAAQVSGASRLLTHAWLVKAHALRESGELASRPAALQAYEEALRHFQSVMVESDPADANLLAKIWMSRGMTLLDDGSPPVLPEALECFERALDLRKALPLEKDWRFAWALSAAWMNRADVLTRLGAPEQLVLAVESYDEAIPLLEGMPMEEFPTCRARLALAWMNRGFTCLAQRSEASLQEALRSFSVCVDELVRDGDPTDAEQRRVLACARLNRGSALLLSSPPDPAGAREESIAAQALAEEFEQTEPLAAQMGLQSRHLLCRAVAHLVDAREAPEDWITEATDAVDDGMALARHWRQLGEERLQEMEFELLRFGALIYRLCQPHFLAEFLLDCLDPERSPGAPVKNPQMHQLASEAMWSVVTDIRAAQQEGGGGSESEQKRLLLMQDLMEAEQRFQQLREQYLVAA